MNELLNVVSTTWMGVEDRFKRSMDNTVDGAQSEVLSLIAGAVSYIGLLFVVLFVIAAVTWMTAQGDAEKVKKSQGMMWTSIAGFVIVLLARVIIAFVISRIPGA